MDTAAAPVPAGWLGWLRRYAVQLAVLVPAVLWVVVREWLQWRLAQLGVALPPSLSPATDPATLIRTVALVLLGCLAFGLLAWWLVRKPGPARPRLPPGRLAWGLLAVWVVLWLAGTVQAVRSQMNVLGVQPGHSETLALVGLRQTPPTRRSTGGAQLYLDWPAQGGLHTVQVETPSPALLQQPRRVQLQVAPGRWYGWYVLDWTVPDAEGPVSTPTTDKAPT